MREKGQQSAKILTHLVTYRGKKKEKCLFLLYVGRCRGKTDICLFFFLLFFYEPFPNIDSLLFRARFWETTKWKEKIPFTWIECPRGKNCSSISVLEQIRPMHWKREYLFWVFEPINILRSDPCPSVCTQTIKTTYFQIKSVFWCKRKPSKLPLVYRILPCGVQSLCEFCALLWDGWGYSKYWPQPS